MKSWLSSDMTGYNAYNTKWDNLLVLKKIANLKQCEKIPMNINVAKFDTLLYFLFSQFNKETRIVYNLQKL